MSAAARGSAVRRGVAIAILSIALVSLDPRLVGTAAVPRPGIPAPQELISRIPLRSPEAITGREFLRQLNAMPEAERRGAVLEQLLEGNLPEFLRDLRAVELTSKPGREPRHRAVIWVMPDYLAIGSDDDFVRMPMGLYTAVTVARRFGFVLPTRKMVDAIHRQSDLRLRPRPMSPGPRMTSPDYLMRHNQIIEQQLAGNSRGLLLSGHKKDVVLTNRLAKKARRVAIYGWEYPDGTPIQPLSTVHGARYADYSHGIRLVSSTVLVDGVPRSVLDVLEDPSLAGVLSYEGPIRNARDVMSLPFSSPAPASTGPPVAAGTPD
jgi:hypothetical protein